MTVSSNRNQVTAAKILLVVVLITIGLDIGTFYRTEYQLVSPFIPKSITLDLSRPYLFAAIISVLAVIAALICYFLSKYLFTIIICAIDIVWQLYFLNWGAY